MKNLLILYLVVLSQTLTGQNSAVAYGKASFSSSGSDYFNFSRISSKKLTPVDHQFSKTENPLLILENLVKNADIELNDFSSLTLKKQLLQLDLSTPFKVTHNATLERFIRVYLQNRRNQLQRLVGKSIYYFPTIEQHLDAYDLPLELKYLAVVESALNPVAVSPSGAKGLWQFMYATGLDYDLYIDSYVDERFDLFKSTQAACAYLKDLYESFGDWNLALAAYNSGPGNVRKAIKRAGGNKNYWEIRSFLPRETSSYVPAFYATMYLFTHAEYHGLGPIKGETSYFETDTIHITKNLSFATITKITGIDLDILRSFNPVYKQDQIPKLKNRTMTLTLPVSEMQHFLEAENDLLNATWSSGELDHSSKILPITASNSYLVARGDNLNSIARKHHISLEQLKRWNGLDTNFLISGQRLVITNTKETIISKKEKRAIRQTDMSPSVQTKKEFIEYTVEHGDTLFKISRKFGNVPISELRTLNNLDNVNYLKPGIQLKIKKSIHNQQS